MFACGYMLHVGKFQPFEFRSRVTDKAGGSGVLFYSADKTPYVVRNRFLLGFFLLINGQFAPEGLCSNL